MMTSSTGASATRPTDETAMSNRRLPTVTSVAPSRGRRSRLDEMTAPAAVGCRRHREPSGGYELVDRFLRAETRRVVVDDDGPALENLIEQHVETALHGGVPVAVDPEHGN